MGSNFTCMFLMMIPICSASLMKFGELWKNVEISWYFKGPALSAFFCEISQLFWIGSNFTCMFLMMIQICSASLMKFGELWKNVEISWYFKGPALSAFFYEISQLLWMGSNFTCMFLMMIPINSASLMKFGELWKNVEISWYFKGPHCQHFSMKYVNFSELAQISHACFWWWFKYVLQVWWNLVNFEKCWNFMIIQRAGTVSFFLWNKSTSLNFLKFHMHVSDDDSNMFCKFDEIWWTLKKCWNFMIFLGPALSAFFCEKT